MRTVIYPQRVLVPPKQQLTTYAKHCQETFPAVMPAQVIFSTTALWFPETKQITTLPQVILRQSSHIEWWV